MILDNDAKLVTTVAFDLGVVNPGRGNPICLHASGVGASLVLTQGATDAAADALMTVDATNDIRFELPSDVARYIKATFVSGEVNFVLPGAQTAV